MRYLLLDRITALEPGERARAVKCVSLADDVFTDHFPGHPVLPGALIVEALAQLGGVLLEATVRQQDGSGERHALLSIIERAKFRRMVRPGDRLRLEARVLRASEDGGQIEAIARVEPAEDPAVQPGGQGEPAVAAEAQLTFALVRVENPKVIARRREIVNTWLHGSAEDP
jgi:3-hydroxymyristoyl/3-hydroxydecanoyl-(acyl carrier protein) dehydratase